MDMKTKYLGLVIDNPFVVGASPLTGDLDTARRLVDAGAAALVLPSVFDVQVDAEARRTLDDVDRASDLSAEAATFFPRPEEFRFGPDAYLEQVRRIKAGVSVPVIASVNGTSLSAWIEYARLLEEAGADAIELNVYYVAGKAYESALQIEDRMARVVTAVKASVKVPVAVKLSPFFTSVRGVADALTAAGADGLVLFNRFYQPDIDIEKLETVSTLKLSDSSELLLRLRWAAILYRQIHGSIIVSGGVHTPADAIKSIMAGADAVQVVSALLQRGPGYLGDLVGGTREWLETHGYTSLGQARGSMSLAKTPNPEAVERANYMRVLSSWKG
jgi:dihydroorotate dehydrogenase (fumarate)